MTTTPTPHRPRRCSFSDVAARAWAYEQVVCLPRARLPASAMLVVPQRLRNASEYLFPCLLHPQIHARTHARSVLLGDAILHIHAARQYHISVLVPSEGHVFERGGSCCSVCFKYYRNDLPVQSRIVRVFFPALRFELLGHGHHPPPSGTSLPHGAPCTLPS